MNIPTMNNSLFRDTNYTYFNPYTQKQEQVTFSIISDIHFSPIITTKKLNKILKQLKIKQPDYILFPGDLIDCADMIQDEKEKERITKFVEQLGTIAPTFMIIGNHDLIKENKKRKSKEEHEWAYGYPKEFFEQLNKLPNIHVLDNAIYENEEVQIIGITQPMEYCENPSQPSIEHESVMIQTLQTNQSLLSKISNKKVTMILTHSPVVLTNPDVLPYLFQADYVISGHMHMGCVPFILSDILRKKHSNKGLIAPKKDLFPDNAQGIKDIKVPIDQAPYYKQCDHKLQFIMDQHTSKDTSISQFIQNLKINKKGLITGPYRLNKNFELCTGKLIISGGTTCIQYCVKSKVLHAGNLVSPMNIETLTLTKNPNENEKCKVKYHK